MKFMLAIVMAACVVVALSFLVAADEARYGDSRVTGPFSHENLDVFFIRGSDLVDNENLLTLNEALKQDKIVVHETGNVQELIIDNTCDSWIFIHAGDIVKGGKQDRVIRVDIIIKPYAKRIYIPAFCVEHGRWSQRGGEKAYKFESSDNIISSKDLKIAAKVKGSQQEVWSEVEVLQDRLGGVAREQVVDPRSESSLQLTLENENVKELTQEYVDAIKNAMGGDDIIGFAFAINGEINSADIYRSHELFMKMWPKLAEACAVEAVAARHETGDFKHVSADNVVAWLEQSERGRASTETVNEQTELKTREDGSNVQFETLDAEDKNMIHKNVIKR